jgi:hypothetical protein
MEPNHVEAESKHVGASLKLLASAAFAPPPMKRQRSLSYPPVFSKMGHTTLNELFVSQKNNFHFFPFFASTVEKSLSASCKSIGMRV